MSSGSDAEMSPAIAPTPLFQRLVTEEVQELKHYTRIIEEQNRRLSEVENITVDLDRKLQKQTKARMDLERTLELRERQWADKFEKLEADRDHWKVVVQKEERMNTRLNDQVARLEQEIHRMLQRKVCACVTRISRAPMWSIILICVRFHSFFSMTTNVVMLRDLCEAYVHTIPTEALHPFPCQLILIRTARLRLLA
jgi:exonuclease VII large subunit